MRAAAASAPYGTKWSQYGTERRGMAVSLMAISIKYMIKYIEMLGLPRNHVQSERYDLGSALQVDTLLRERAHTPTARTR